MRQTPHDHEEQSSATHRRHSTHLSLRRARAACAWTRPWCACAGCSCAPPPPSSRTGTCGNANASEPTRTHATHVSGQCQITRCYCSWVTGRAPDGAEAALLVDGLDLLHVLSGDVQSRRGACVEMKPSQNGALSFNPCRGAIEARVGCSLLTKKVSCESRAGCCRQERNANNVSNRKALRAELTNASTHLLRLEEGVEVPERALNEVVGGHLREAAQ